MPIRMAAVLAQEADSSSAIKPSNQLIKIKDHLKESRAKDY